MGFEIKYIGTTEPTIIPYVSVQLIWATATTSYHQKMFQKIRILKKAFLCSSCSALVIKKFKKAPMKEFRFRKIMVLHAATFPNKQLSHNHFSKFLKTIVE